MNPQGKGKIEWTVCPRCGSHHVEVFKRFMAKGTKWTKLWGCECGVIFETPYEQPKGCVCPKCQEKIKQTYKQREYPR